MTQGGPHYSARNAASSEEHGPPHVLIVEDDPRTAELTGGVAERLGCRWTATSTAAAAIAEAEKEPPRIVVLDYQLGGPVTGLEVLEQLGKLSPSPIVILVTGYGSEEVAAEALRKGAFDYVNKGADATARLEAAIKRAMAHAAAVDAIARKQAELAESERFFRSIYREGPLPYQCVDANGTILAVNPQWCALLGYDESEVRGRPLAEFVRDAQRQDCIRRSVAIPASFGRQECELELLHREGGLVPVRCYCRPGVRQAGERQVHHCILVDLRPERRAQAEAAERAREVLQILETMQEGIWLCDTDDITTLVNRRMAEMLGYEPEEMVGRSILDFIVPEEREDQRQRSRMRCQRPRESFHRRLLTKDGQVRPFLVSVTASFDEKGVCRGSVGMLTDMSELTSREREYRQMLRLFHGTAAAVPDVVFILDEQQRIRYANRATEQQLGTPAQSLLGRPCHEVIHGLEEPPSWCPFCLLNGTGTTKTTRMHEPRLGGWFDVSVTPIEETTDGERLFAHVARDVTAQVESEQKLRRTVEFLRALVDLATRTFQSEDDLLAFALERCAELSQSPLGYVHLVRDGEVNLQLLVWTRATMEVCKAPLDRHYPLSEAGVWADAVRYRRPVIHNDYQNLPDRRGYPEGHPLIERHMSVPIFSEDRVVAVVGLGNKQDPYDEEDATEVAAFFSDVWHILTRLRAERKLHRLNLELADRVKQRTAQLQRTNENLDAFVYAISHDLRGAITRVMMYSEEIARRYGDVMDDVGKRDLGWVVEGARDLADMQDALLRLSRETRGSVSRTRVDLSAVADQYLRAMRSFDPDRAVDVRIERSVEAYCDQAMAKRVLDNLLANAWKYTADCRPAVIEFGTVERKGRRWCYVRDNGMGFPPEFASKAFLPFARWEDHEALAGQGVGLSIVRRIVDIHGGDVEAESEVGRGATFYFHFGEDTPPADA